MSHGPQLLTPPEKWPELPVRIKGPFTPKPGIEAELTGDAMRSHAARCEAAIGALRAKLDSWAPDTIVIIGDDQNENILRDNMPPFTIFMDNEVDATLRYRYAGEKDTDQMTRYAVNAPLAENLIDGLMDSGFDPSWSRETRYPAGLGHAFGRVLNFVLPAADVAIVPVMINTYYPPVPSAKRCFDFGVALGRLIRESGSAEKVALVGSGGLSHTRIDEKLDQDFMAALQSHDADYLSSMPSDVLVSGTSEIRNWIVVAGAAGGGGSMVDYVPCYRNADGVGCAMGFAYWEMAA
jgi:3-O-methylgallate 3,4-dioxygenase